jgi:16S rRNA (cytosine967-C5)-methyltransferase
MPRATALEVLDAVLRRRRPLDQALADHPGLARLAGRDRALARNLVATTLRRLGQIDDLIAHCLKRPLPHKASAAHDILRLGVCQLVVLRTPPHAAVDTSVRLAQERGQGPHKSLINAVLRRLADEGPGLAEAQDAPRLNTPTWLWDSWSATYGAATCRRIATAHLTEAPLDMTVKADSELWAERLGGVVVAAGSVRRPAGGRVEELPGYAEGAWWVQDAAAALPVRLLGDVGGRRVIDLCAAPGGKAAQLAVAGAKVTSVDRSPARMGRLRENMARLGLDVETVVADATDWRPEKPADAVLLDAPCAATGTIRRHPDIARLKTPEDVAALASVQMNLLKAAAEIVRPGGLVVYCACSLQPEECESAVSAAIAAGAPLEPVPMAPGDIGGPEDVPLSGGALRTLPCHWAEAGGMDGFYAARLRRV